MSILHSDSLTPEYQVSADMEFLSLTDIAFNLHSRRKSQQPHFTVEGSSAQRKNLLTASDITAETRPMTNVSIPSPLIFLFHLCLAPDRSRHACLLTFFRSHGMGAKS